MTVSIPKLAELFSAEAFRRLSLPTGLAHVRETVDAAQVPGLGRRMRLRMLFDKAYDHLLRSYRFEYIYKNSITNALLLDRHDPGNGPNGARLLTEFWVGDVRADLAIINGTSTAYEVKTSLDTLDRLPQQLLGYSKLFDRIYVVTSQAMLPAVKRVVPPHVGILMLEDDGSLLQVKLARTNKVNIDVHTIFRSLRELEVLQICRRRADIPADITNGIRSQQCWDVFRKLSPEEAHDEMASALRSRTIHPAQQQLLKVAPRSLKHHCIGKVMNIGQYRAISSQLDAAV